MAPLRAHTFRWFFASRSVNLLGNTMAPVALAFGVLEVSDSPTALGAVLAAHMIPMVALLLLGGVLADRLGRGRVIQVSNVVSGVSRGSMAVLLLTGTAQLWHLVALAAVAGVAAALGMPALNGIVPALVPRERLQEANVLLSFTRAGLMVVGPSLSAGLVVTVGAGWALLIDAATWLVAALLLLPVRIPPRTGPQHTLIVELREGWDFFRGTTWLWVGVSAFAVLNALHEGGLTLLGPVQASRTSIGEEGWGLALSAQAVGALLVTIAFMRWSMRRPLLLGMLGNALFGVPMLVLALWPQTTPLVIACFVSGIGVQVFSLGWALAMQENVPDEMLPRAYSYDQLGSFAVIPLGQLAMGPLALRFGIADVLLVAGLAYVAICLLTLVPASVRRLARATEPDLIPSRAG